MKKIAIATEGENLNSKVSSVGARAPYFLIFDSDFNLEEIIKNPFRVGGGAGIGAASLLKEKGINSFIAGAFGPNMAMSLRESGVKIYQAQDLTVEEVLRKLQKKELEEFAPKIPSWPKRGTGFKGWLRGRGLGWCRRFRWGWRKWFGLFLLILFLPFTKTSAVCPVCTVAVGCGVGLSRYLGVDDLISGLWIGAFLFSSGLWLIDYLSKKGIKFAFRNFLILFFVYLLGFLSLKDFIGHYSNKIFGLDKLIFGIILGTVVLIIAIFIDKVLRRRNQEKVYFPYQKVIIPLILLIISTLILYFFFCG
jgi:predicted Fe-Mo cluster-binding NifX family protein